MKSILISAKKTAKIIKALEELTHVKKSLECDTSSIEKLIKYLDTKLEQAEDAVTQSPVKAVKSTKPMVIVETFEEKITRVLRYFISNPEKRCIKNGRTAYCGETIGMDVQGSIVGMLLDDSTRRAIDEAHPQNISIRTVSDIGVVTLPSWVIDHLDLLQSLQNLHDDADCWKHDGLTPKGQLTLLSSLNVLNPSIDADSILISLGLLK